MTSATTTSEAQVSYFMISTDKCGLAADLATGCTIPCLLSSTENFKANSMNELPLVKFYSAPPGSGALIGISVILQHKTFSDHTRQDKFRPD